jgi:hypothetical protein
MDYEAGALTTREIVQLFADLLNSGLIYQLQGSYGRQAQQLIEENYLIRRRGKWEINLAEFE